MYMSLDVFVHEDPEVQALIKVTGAYVGYLAPHPEQGVYVQVRHDGRHAGGTISVSADLPQWREFLGNLLDKIK